MAKRRRGKSRKPIGIGSALLAVVLLALYVFLSDMNPPSSSERDEPASSVSAVNDVTGGEEALVYFFDVGQGDSALLRIPQESGYFNTLLDTGEYKYADGLTSALQELGVEKLDALICSHPHTDHMGCMARMVERFEIGSVYMPQVPDEYAPTTAAYEALLDAVIEKELTITALHEGVEISAPAGAKFEVFAPEENADWGDDMNNYSAAVKFTYGETSFLFTGDAEKQSEEIMLEKGFDLSADVFKCGHHGSSTSNTEEFLETISPEYAVISCEKGNSYGHPHDEVMELLNDMQLKIYRTDEDKTILAKTDGKIISFETQLPSVEAS